MKYIEALERIENRIEELFGGLDFKTNSLPIETLMSARSYYVQLFAYLSEMEAAAFHTHKTAEHKRKNSVLKAKIKYMDKPYAYNVSKSTIHADIDCDELYEEEIEAEANWRLYKNRRESAKEVSANLSQIIGVARQELEQTQFRKD